MKLLPLAEEVLTNVLEKNIPFSLALKNCFKYKTIEKSERNVVSSITGCALRHYIVFDYHIKAIVGQVTTGQRICLMLALADQLFIKKFNKKDILLEATSQFEKQEDEERVEKLLKEINDASKLIPEQFKPESFEYLSMRFNTPLWVVKMWHKHYGFKFTYKILKANSKPAANSIRVNASVTSTGRLLEKYPTLFEESSYEDMLNYVGNDAFNNTDAYKNKEAFALSNAMKYMVDKVDVDSLRGIAIYSGYSNHLFLELMAKFSSFYRADLVCGQSQAYFDSKKQIERYELKNIATYECGPSSILACISRPVHTFFVLPLSTNFALLRKSPDYFLRINQDNLDELISNEMTALVEASDLVEENGELVYAVPTLNLKESHKLIMEFLSSHKDYVLEDEKQFYPFDPYDSTLYYAVMKKAGIRHD